MAIIASTGKRRNFKESLWARANQCWFGQDSTGIDIPPNLLNNDYMTAVNAAGTGTVNMLAVDANDRIVAATGIKQTVTAIAANGAVAPRVCATYAVTKAGVCAMTLAAPTATTDDGLTICITSATANAHTLTATGLLQPGTAAVNLATFAAFPGAGLTLMAWQGKWNVIASVGITYS